MSTTAATALSVQDGTRSSVSLFGLIRRFPFAALVILTFALAWLFEIPWVLDARGELPFAFPFRGVLLMGWMPGVAAILVAVATGGRPAVRKLFGRILIRRVSWTWYLLVSGGTAAIWLGAVTLNPLFGGSGLHMPDLSFELLIGLKFC